MHNQYRDQERKVKDGKSQREVGQEVQEHNPMPLGDEEFRLTRQERCRSLGKVFFKGGKKVTKNTTGVGTDAFCPRVFLRRVCCGFHRPVAIDGKLDHVSSAAKSGGQWQTTCTTSDTDPLVGMGRSRHHGTLEKTTSSGMRHANKRSGRQYIVWEAMPE